MIGFLEEAQGVRSMTRLAIGWLLVLSTAIVGVSVWYVLHGKPESSVLLALGSILTALVLKGAVAIKNRNPVDDEK